MTNPISDDVLRERAERRKLASVTAFDAWWSADGQYLDPDTSDVPWFDKRRALAEYAYRAGRNNGLETAWLVEVGARVLTTPHWWSLPVDDEPQWTSDSLKALRFARREDAEAYIREAGWTEAFASEHQWGDPAFLPTPPTKDTNHD